MRFIATGILAWAVLGCSAQQERSPALQAAETRGDLQQQRGSARGILAPFALEVDEIGPVAPGQEVEARIRLRLQGALRAPIDLKWKLGPGVHLLDGVAAERIEAVSEEGIARALRLRVDDPGARLEVIAQMRGDGFGATARRAIFFDGRPSEDSVVPRRERPPGGYELQPRPKGQTLPQPSHLPPGLPVGKP